MFVGSVVIGDDVERFVFGCLLVNEPEKRNPILIGMAVPALAQHTSVESIQSGEQSGCSMPLIIVCHGFATTLLHRQTGLRTIQCLNLTLLIDGKHNRLLRRIEIQADNVFEFFGKLRIVADLERLCAVGFQTVRMPHPTNASFADSNRPSHAPCTPVGSVFGSFLRGLANNFFRVQLGRAARSGRILLDSANAQFQESLAPPRHRVSADLQLSSYVQVLLAFSGEQNNPCPLYQTLRNPTSAGIGPQLSLLSFAECDEASDPHGLFSLL